MKVDIQYRRVIGGDFCILADHEVCEFKSKTQMLKHVRARKKQIAEECHYRWPRDVVEYIIRDAATGAILN